jgi:hypothetical protein
MPVSGQFATVSSLQSIRPCPACCTSRRAVLLVDPRATIAFGAFPVGADSPLSATARAALIFKLFLTLPPYVPPCEEGHRIWKEAAPVARMSRRSRERAATGDIRGRSPRSCGLQASSPRWQKARRSDDFVICDGSALAGRGGRAKRRPGRWLREVPSLLSPPARPDGRPPRERASLVSIPQGGGIRKRCGDRSFQMRLSWGRRQARRHDRPGRSCLTRAVRHAAQ